MSEPKFVCYVAIFWQDGPHEDDPDMYARFVTSLDNQSRMARWEAGKPAMPFAESYARDIVYGLTVNGYAAGVVKAVNGVTFTNPEQTE